jgi:hypothetical protein
MPEPPVVPLTFQSLLEGSEVSLLLSSADSFWSIPSGCRQVGVLIMMVGPGGLQFGEGQAGASLDPPYQMVSPAAL